MGFGPRDARVAVVGINPSRRAADGVKGCFSIPYLARLAARGVEPGGLVGAERAFWALAREADVDLTRVYSTNAVKCATPGNRKPTPAEVMTCAATHLMTEMETLLELRTIVVYGKVAGAVLGLSDFGIRRTVDNTLAEGVLLRHPISVLRRWTRLGAEAQKLRAAVFGPAPP